MEEEKSKSYRHYLDVFRDVLVSHGEQLIQLKLELHALKKQMQDSKASELNQEVEDLLHANKNAIIVLTELLKDKKVLKDRELHKKYMQLMSGRKSILLDEKIAVISRAARKRSEKVVLPKTALSYTICKRFFRKAGADRVGDDALVAYNKLIISTANRIISVAIQLQKKSGEKKLTEYHIRDAYEILLTKTSLPPEVLDTLKTYAPGIAPAATERTRIVKRAPARKVKAKKAPAKKVKRQKTKKAKRPAKKRVSRSKELFPLKTDVVVLKDKKPKRLTETTQTVTTSRTVKKLE